MKSRNASISIALSIALLAGCGGGGGGGTDAPTLPVSLSLQASATEAKVNTTVTLTWSAANANSCTASGAWTGTKSASGTESVALAAEGDNRFSLMCAGNGSQSASQLVVIRGMPACTHTSVADGQLVSTVEQLQAVLTDAGGNGRDDVIYVAAGTYKPSATLVYDAKGGTEKISIVGCGASEVVFDGQKARRVFHFQRNGFNPELDLFDLVAPYPSLVISGITVKDGYDSDFNGNTGGGILAEQFLTQISDSSFIDNQSMRFGGGIGGTAGLVVRNAQFVGNNGNRAGGAIRSFGNVDIADSNFIGNTGGWAVMIENGVTGNPISQVVFTRVTFSKNAAALILTGGVGADTEPLTITDSLFEDSSFVALDLNTSSEVVIRGSKFLRNGPRQRVSGPTGCLEHNYCSAGGAIWDRSGDGVITIENSEFRDNYSPDFGGAIDMAGTRNCDADPLPCNPLRAGVNPEINLILKNVIFAGNVSHRGAAVAVGRVETPLGFQRGNVKIEGGSFSGNTGVQVPLPDGAVSSEDRETSILATGGNIQACGTTFSDNVADKEVFAKGIYSFTATCP